MADPFGTFGFTNVFPFPPSAVGTFGNPKISYGYTTNPHFRTPYSENFNYGFQWQATKDTMVEAVYVGSLGRKLISTSETNFPNPTVEMEQLNDFGFVSEYCSRPMAACVGRYYAHRSQRYTHRSIPDLYEFQQWAFGQRRAPTHR